MFQNCCFSNVEKGVLLFVCVFTLALALVCLA